MENDTTDMELLLAIENEAITHHIALTEVTMPEYNLSAMDLSPYQTSVQNMIGEISSLYAGYANSGQQAFLSIAQSGNNLATQLGGVGELMKKVDDPKHSLSHVLQVVEYTKEILQHVFCKKAIIGTTSHINMFFQIIRRTAPLNDYRAS